MSVFTSLLSKTSLTAIGASSDVIDVIEELVSAVHTVGRQSSVMDKILSALEDMNKDTFK